MWPCLKWSSCCFRIPDPICILYNVGCAIIRAALEIAIAIAEAALLIAEGVLYAAEGVVRGLQVIVDQARFVLDAINLVLEALKKTLAVGLAALEAITKFLLTGLIDIREIGFDVAISAFSHGSVAAYIDVSFLGKAPVRLSVSFPLYNPLALVPGLAEKVVPGIGKKKRSIGKRKNKVFM